MGQIENWVQFTYVANLLERKGNYIEETGSKERGIEYTLLEILWFRQRENCLFSEGAFALCYKDFSL